jgi:hypothetical protein
MNPRRPLRAISAVLAAVFALGIAADYFLWTAEAFGPMENRAATVMLRFYLLYGLTLIFAAQAVSGLPAWKLPAAWNGLKPWQRGLIGVAVVLVAIAAHFVFVGSLERRGLIDEGAIP